MKKQLLTGALAFSTLAVGVVGQVDSAAAAALVTNNGQPTGTVIGINELQIGDFFYDVSFDRANFNSLFGDPTDNNPPFTAPTFWLNQSGAEAAVAAINQFLTAQGQFTTTQSGTNSFLGNQLEYFIGYNFTDVTGPGNNDLVSTVRGQFANSVWNSTSGVQNLIRGGGESQFIYAVFDNARAVPTPALLPGLIGMGIAALRKKKQAEEATQEA